MVTINDEGYFERQKTIRSKRGRPNTADKNKRRDWWLGVISITMSNIQIPKRYQGKRLKFKVEVCE